VRIPWLTDIHLDHLADERIDALSEAVAEARPDAVLVTGDISVAPRLGADLERFAARFDAPVYFVAGNHDYWGASVRALRPALSRLTEAAPRMRWLQSAGPVWLDGHHALIGVDGWADARHGDYARSPVRLRDYQHIEELATGGMAKVLVARRPGFGGSSVR